MSLKTIKTTDFSKDIESLEAEQSDYIKIASKYKYVPPTEKDGLIKEVHEYKCPDGSVGYQIFLRKIEEDKIYQMSKGFGKEDKYRTYDWRELIKD